MQEKSLSPEAAEILERYHSDPDSIVVCHICDKIYDARIVMKDNQTAHCHRCHASVIRKVHVPVEHTVALAITSFFLMIGAAHYEFLGLYQTGFSQKTSLVKVVESFTDGWYVLLGIFVAMFVLGMPMLRSASLIYVMWPLLFDRPPYPHARRVFAISQAMGPWLMTEIFIIGTAVALVKMVSLASVEIGPSFWIFCLLVLCMALMDNTVHHRAVWDLLKDQDE